MKKKLLILLGITLLGTSTMLFTVQSATPEPASQQSSVTPLAANQ